MGIKFEQAEAVILAGGPGSRLGELTRNQQKCLLPIDGRPILGHILSSLAIALGPADVTLCVSHRAGDVHEYITRNTPKGLRVQLLEDDGHGKTTGLYRSTQGLVRGTFVGAAGDVIATPDVYRDVYERALEEGVFASVALATRVHEVNTHAVGKVKDGRVSDVTFPPPTALDNDHLRDMTIWGLTQSVHSFADEHVGQTAIPNLLSSAVAEGLTVNGVVYENHWVHVAYPEDLNKSMANTLS